MRAKEREIVRELRHLTANPQFKGRDLLEWDTAPLEAECGEAVYYLPKQRVYCAVKTSAVKSITL
jgi:hypothetical protein